MADYRTWLKEANAIAGAWVGADSGKTIDVTNPATGEVIGTVPNAGRAETERAIAAASEAFPGFAAILPDPAHFFGEISGILGLKDQPVLFLLD